MNTIQRTIEIDNSRRLRLDLPLPETIPCGTTRVEIRFITLTHPETPPDDETEYLLKSPANREKILKSIDDIEHGRNIISFDSLEDAIKAAQGQARDKFQ